MINSARFFCLLYCCVVVNAAFGNIYFENQDTPRIHEYCPSVIDIKHEGDFFTSPANTKGVEWFGTLSGGGQERVADFKKALFLLDGDRESRQGFLSSCIYVTSAGRNVVMRLNLGEDYKKIMRIERPFSWRERQAFSSTIIFECTEQYRSACGFSFLDDVN